MARPLTPETARHVARLARLAPDEAELERVARELGDVLDHVEALQELDVSAVDPMYSPVPIVNHLAPDTPGDTLSTDAALANAPQREGPLVAVTRVLDEDAAT